MAGPTVDFWQQHFEQGHTPWDRGAPNPRLLAWLDQGALTRCRIAVPGCGSGWEVAELARRGFDVVAIDYTPAAVHRTRDRLHAASLSAQVMQADVLGYAPQQPFDAVWEQTCLCALYPDYWCAYAAQLERWVRPGGSLWALFLQWPRPDALEKGLIQGPPYHCDINAVRALFPEPRWAWPAPPYAQVPPPPNHPAGIHELGLRLMRR